MRGTAQNPDVFFQGREAAQRVTTWRRPDIVQRAMERFGALTGRTHRLFEYHGAPDADARDRDHGIRGRNGPGDGRRARPGRADVGVLTVKLYRPWSVDDFVARAAADRPTASRCSTARRSRAPSASRSIRTS